MEMLVLSTVLKLVLFEMLSISYLLSSHVTYLKINYVCRNYYFYTVILGGIKIIKTSKTVISVIKKIMLLNPES